jgi:hypothetical protein
LAEQQGVAYAKTVAEAMGLVLSFSFWQAFCSAIYLAIGFCSARADLRELRPADAVLVRRRP